MAISKTIAEEPINWVIFLNCCVIETVYIPLGYVWVYFAVVMLLVLSVICDPFTHILQGCFTGIGAILQLPHCQWSNPGGKWVKSATKYKPTTAKCKPCPCFTDLLCSESRPKCMLQSVLNRYYTQLSRVKIKHDCTYTHKSMVLTDLEKCLNLNVVLKSAWFFSLPWKLSIFLEKCLKTTFSCLKNKVSRNLICLCIFFMHFEHLIRKK